VDSEITLRVCPNLAELNFQFQDPSKMNKMSKEKIRMDIEDFRKYLEDRDEVEFEEIWMARKDHAFAPYPVLHNIQSLRVGKMSNRITSFFSINVILSCPNLRHLFVSEERWFSFLLVDLIDWEGPDMILHFLSKRPEISRRLEIFGWQDDDDTEGCWSSNVWMRRQRESLQRSRDSSLHNLDAPRPFLQFGGRQIEQRDLGPRRTPIPTNCTNRG
jgi:hypothetical protein